MGGGGAGSDGSGGWTKHFHPCLLALGSWSLYILCLSGECGDVVELIANKMCIAASAQTSCDSAVHSQLISTQTTH